MSTGQNYVTGGGDTTQPIENTPSIDLSATKATQPTKKVEPTNHFKWTTYFTKSGPDTSQAHLILFALHEYRKIFQKDCLQSIAEGEYENAFVAFSDIQAIDSILLDLTYELGVAADINARAANQAEFRNPRDPDEFAKFMKEYLPGREYMG